MLCIVLLVVPPAAIWMLQSDRTQLSEDNSMAIAAIDAACAPVVHIPVNTDVIRPAVQCAAICELS